MFAFPSTILIFNAARTPATDISQLSRTFLRQSEEYEVFEEAPQAGIGLANHPRVVRGVFGRRSFVDGFICFGLANRFPYCS